jgi:hypothetical protein
VAASQRRVWPACARKFISISTGIIPACPPACLSVVICLGCIDVLGRVTLGANFFEIKK